MSKLNKVFQRMYGENDEITTPVEWLFAIYRDGICMGEYCECQDMNAVQAYTYALESAEDVAKANNEPAWHYQVWIRPATEGDKEA